MARRNAETGQASVELVAVLPLLAVVALISWQAVVAAQAVWLAGGAARAAARAQALGGDPLAAARRALPVRMRRGVRAEPIAGGGVRLRIDVPVVGLSAAKVGTITARARLQSQR